MAGALAVVAVLAVGQADAQSNDLRSLVSTIDRLERQLQALERTVYRGETPPPASLGPAAGATGGVPPAAVSQLQLRTDQLEEQLRQLTGQIEELGFQVRQIDERLDRLVADVDFRLRSLEEASGQTGAAGTAGASAARTAPAPSAPRAAPGGDGAAISSEGAPGPVRRFGVLTESQMQAAGVDPAAAAEQRAQAGLAPATEQASATPGDGSGLPPGSPEDRYDYARGFLMRRDFDGAERALRAFVDTYPENALAGNAQYWLGETYYVRSDFERAARSFAEGFRRYPDSGKAPDNLLKLGMSLAALDRTEDACITLQKLTVEYPEAAANIVQRAERERARLKCN